MTTNAFSTGRVGLYDFSGQSFDNVVITAVPEPGSLAMLGIGGIGVLGSALRRRALIPNS